MSDGKTTAGESVDNSAASGTDDGSFLAGEENKADAGESRRAVLHTLADVEQQLQHAQATGQQIGETAGHMRRGVHGEIERLERSGMVNLEEEARYRQLLLDRRQCDVVGALNQEEGL